MSDITVKTAQALWLELQRAKGGTYAPLAFSTLNEVHGVFHGEAIPTDTMPEIKYFAIGRGGHRNVTDPSGESLSDPQQHQIVDAHIFKPLPLVMREVNDDLTDVQKERYRMRKLINVNGTNYFAYYLLVVDLSASAPTMRHVDATGGTEVITPYVPSAANLTAPAVTVTNSQVNNSTGIHLLGTIGLSVELTPNDLDEILNCVDLLFNDRRFSVITEQALVAGIDKEVTSADGGTPTIYTEAITSSVQYYINKTIPVEDYRTNGGTLTFDLGNSLPWLT